MVVAGVVVLVGRGVPAPGESCQSDTATRARQLRPLPAGQAGVSGIAPTPPVVSPAQWHSHRSVSTIHTGAHHSRTHTGRRTELLCLQGSLGDSLSEHSTSQKGAGWGRRASALVVGWGPNSLFSKVSTMSGRLSSHRPGTWFWKDRPDKRGHSDRACRGIWHWGAAGRPAAGVALTRPLNLTCSH